MPMYIKFEDVKLRLVGKVQFTEDDTDENKMSKTLALRLIDEAEGQVEVDLSPRYAAPFASTAVPNTFAAIPERPTKNIIRTLCELKAVIRILETDFGAGTAVDSSKYTKAISDRYKDIINNSILAKIKDKEDQRQWQFPPLPGLMKAYHNTEADDGFAGIGPLVTSESEMDRIENQISDPAEDFFNAKFHD